MGVNMQDKFKRRQSMYNLSSRFNSKGFTLMEMVIIIVIIGILILAIVPNIMKSIESSQKNAARTDVNLLVSALNTYNFSVNKRSDQITTATTATDAESKLKDKNKAIDGVYGMAPRFSYSKQDLTYTQLFAMLYKVIDFEATDVSDLSKGGTFTFKVDEKNNPVGISESDWKEIWKNY
jgi:competence protein ComGC